MSLHGLLGRHTQEWIAAKLSSMHLQARLPLPLAHENFGVLQDIYHGRPTILSEKGSSMEIRDGEVCVLQLTDLTLPDGDFEENIVDLCQVML